MGNQEKYNQAKIYKLRDLSTEKIYIGSTILPLKHRLALHKSSFKRYNQGVGTYASFYDIIENNNYVIEVVEYYPTTDRNELLKRERYHIENNECINRQKKPITSDEEREKVRKDYSKLWYVNNREYKNNYQKCQYQWKRVMRNVVFIE